jgi:hypothetical protein
LIFAFSLQAKTIFVNKEATGANDGSNWGNAYKELSAALPTAQYGDEIWVAKGRYLPFIEGVTNTFTMVSGVKLLGGFGGWESEESERDAIANGTTLAGEFVALPNGIFYPSYNVIYCAGTDSSTLVDGFLIYNMFSGPFNNESCDDDQHKCYGGDIFMYSGSPDEPTFLTVRNCNFIESNCCAAGGGAIGVNFLYGSGGFTLEKCVFKKCSAFEAAAMHIVIGTAPQYKILIDSCRFEDNRAFEYVGVATIFNYNLSADFTFSNCLFLNNRAKTNGGIWCATVAAGEPVKFINCSFIGNAVGTSGLGQAGAGGALGGQKLFIKNCLFKNNRAFKAGAINGDRLRIENSLFINNYATREGGAIRTYTGQNYYSNCVFLNNYTTYRGAGIMIGGVGISKDTIINSIFWANRLVDSSNWISTYGANVYVANTVIDALSCEDARAGFLPDDTLTCGPNMFFQIDPLFRDTAASDYRLAGCSPVLNKGDAAWVARFGMETDYAGNDRSLDGLPDIGAFETAKFSALHNWQNAHCYGSDDGVVSVFPQGGYSPYSAHWEDGYQGLVHTGLTAGLYSIQVSDSDQCSETIIVQVSQPDSLSLQATVEPSKDSQNHNGVIAIDSVFGGIIPYTLAWSNGSTQTQIMGLSPGTYTVTVTDWLGCTLTAEFEVDFMVGTSNLSNQSFAMFPNPASTYIQFDLSQLPAQMNCEQLSIFDETGRMVLKQEIGQKSDYVRLEIKNLVPGVYLYQFGCAGKKSIGGRFVKQK